MTTVSISQARQSALLVRRAIAVEGATVELCDFPEVRAEKLHVVEAESVLSLGLSRLLSGSQGRLVDDPRRQFARFGALAFRPAGVEMEIDLASGSFQTVRIRFADDRIASSLGTEPFSEEVLAACFDIHSQPIGDAMLRLAGEAETPGTDTFILVDALVTAILVDLGRYLRAQRQIARRSRGGLSARALRIALSMMEAAAPEPHIDDLAKACGLSRHHFIRCFRQSTGIGPGAWLRQQRMDRAKAMLTEGQCTVAQVAQATGYAGAPAFIAAFRRATGRTPGDWRAQMR